MMGMFRVLCVCGLGEGGSGFEGMSVGLGGVRDWEAGREGRRELRECFACYLWVMWVGDGKKEYSKYSVIVGWRWRWGWGGGREGGATVFASRVQWHTADANTHTYTYTANW